jgi:hypothetical protein
MRQYILTEQEKQVIKEYLETGKKLEGFRTILCRVRNMQAVSADLELIKQFLAKVQERKQEA